MVGIAGGHAFGKHFYSLAGSLDLGAQMCKPSGASIAKVAEFAPKRGLHRFPILRNGCGFHLALQSEYVGPEGAGIGGIQLDRVLRRGTNCVAVRIRDRAEQFLHAIQLISRLPDGDQKTCPEVPHRRAKGYFELNRMPAKLTTLASSMFHC